MKYKSFTQTLCTIYLAVLFIVYPLFQKDHYYNMGNNKYMFYLISTITFLVLVFFSIISNPKMYKSTNNKKKKKNKGKNKATEVVDENEASKNFLIKIKDKFMAWFGPKSIVEKFVWAYLLCAIISFIFGIDKEYGFWGADGWNMGLLVQCLMIACFFVYAKVWEPNMTPFYFSMIGSSIVMFLGIIMRFDIDPLGNYEGLEQKYIDTFISTIGQTSWYSGYIITVIPIGIALFFIAEEKKSQIISLIYTILSCLALAIADSDSILLGLAGVILVLFWVAFDEEKHMVKFFEVTTIMSGSFVVMEYMKIWLNDWYNTGRDITSANKLNEKIYMTGFVFSLLFLFILVALNKKKILKIVYKNKKMLNVFRITIYTIVILVVVSIVIYIILNTMGVFGVTEDMITWAGNIWYFNGAWGHDRGASWMTCWAVFRDYSLGRKLIGIGPDSLEVAIQCNEEYRYIITSVFGEDNVLSCAHNEFYNHLVVYGILGGGTYLGMYISGIVRNIKSFVKKPVVLVGAVCIASYIGHNFFCYQTVLCTPFLLVIMGVCESFLKE